MKWQQNSYCKVNIPLRCVRVTVVTVENNKYYILRACVCSLSFAASNVHSPFCYLWSVRLISYTARFSESFVGHTVCVLIFSTIFVWNIYHSNRNSARYCHKCTLPFIEGNPYSFQILIKIYFFSTDFRKNSQTSGFMKIVPVGAKLSYADGRTDVTEIIVAFRTFAKEPEKKWSVIMIHCNISSLHSITHDS